MTSDSRIGDPLLPAGVRRFTLEEIDAEPWRNGGGRTRTVAASNADGELRWRISAADIDVDGDFSTFDGMDRTAVLMRGENLALRLTDRTLHLPRMGAVVQFPGEAPVRACLAGAPARLWNVMTRRGRAQVDTQVLGAESMRVLPGETAVVVVLAGRVQVRAQDSPQRLGVLSAGQGLVCSGSHASLMLVGLAAIDAVDAVPCWVRSALQTPTSDGLSPRSRR